MNSRDFRPLVSIVIPVYNGANYMREAIDSALSQTYDNVEVIVVNDGSRDGGATDAIAKSYGKRIRYFSKENGGCGSALNTGIAQMQGEYFSWLSHDDLYLPDKIEHQVKVLSDLEDRRTILLGGWEVMDKEGKSIVFVRPEVVHSRAKLNTRLYALLRGLVHGCALLVPANLFREIGTFDETLPTTQDYALWFKFMRVAPVQFDPKILIRSRAHPEQGTHSISGHIDECNQLWSGFLKQVSGQEMVAMEGSRYLFLRRTADFLTTTPYVEASAVAESMAQECLAQLKVSVIVPFHNRLAWAQEAIGSVLSQSHQNFEVLLIDDGSTDDIAPIEKACVSDPRLKLLRQSKAGPAKARNRGVAEAAGDFVAFLDSDDLFEREKLAKQLRAMLDHDLSFSHTSYLRINLEGEALGVVDSGTFSGRVFPRIMASCPIAMPTVMGRTSLFRANAFPEHIDIGEDVCLWIQIASSYEIAGIQEPLSRVRVGALTAAFNKRKQAVGMVNILNFLIHHDFYSQFDRQLRSLLLDTAGLYGTIEGPQIAMGESKQVPAGVLPTPTQLPVERPSLIAMTARSLRNDGLSVTLRRIFRKLGLTA